MDKDLLRFIDLAKELGAHDAIFIDPGTIKTAAWVKMKCMYGCRSRKVHCCPPNTPTYKETQEVIDCYNKALLIHGKDMALYEVVLKLEREIFLAGYYKAVGFGNGDCQLCKTCNAEKCAHPREARPSMEACGIDVFETARTNGFPITVVQNRDSEGNYYGLILIE